MAHFAYAIAFFLAAQACVWWNTWLMEQMIKAVNLHRAPDQQITSSFSNRAKTNLIEVEYHRLYPQGRLPRWRTISLMIGFISFLLTAIMFFNPYR